MYLEERISELEKLIKELKCQVEIIKSIKKDAINKGKALNSESNCHENCILRKFNNKDELLSTSEISKLLKCNNNQVGILMKAGLLPYLQLGSRKVRKFTFESFLEKYEGWDLVDPYNPRKINND